MGDAESESADKLRFMCDYAKRKAGCQRCKKSIEKLTLRIAKCTPDFFNGGEGELKRYYHVECIFEQFARARPTTKKVENSGDIDGFDQLGDQDQELINKCIQSMHKKRNAAKTPTKKPPKTENKKKAVIKEDTKKPAEIQGLCFSSSGYFCQRFDKFC